MLKLISLLLIFSSTCFAGPYLNKANQAAHAGNHQEALSYLNQEVSSGDKARAFKVRAHVHASQGNFTLALADMNQFVTLVPNAAIGYVDRAIVHAKMGNKQLALQDLDRALAIKPKSAYTLLLKHQIENSK